ncbi:SRPBCC family protein [Chitinophaga alhagiae]|uniref:SRPBCC family protein n=1 Tax=Chitinophaga alhagiae TaxID=2203219 RepID=UPI001E528AB3|nr:SRPBCC domain-containing protein [Chitinophaga alhagiae]
MVQQIEKAVIINAAPRQVWNALTDPALVRQWMGGPEMNITVATNWQVGQPVTISGFHHLAFENKGTVLQFEPESLLKYDYLSSLSRLPDVPESRTILAFALTPQHEHTLLTLTLSNFPTEAIFRHVDFYWRGTLEILRRFVEGAATNTKSI